MEDIGSSLIRATTSEGHDVWIGRKTDAGLIA